MRSNIDSGWRGFRRLRCTLSVVVRCGANAFSENKRTNKQTNTDNKPKKASFSTPQPPCHRHRHKPMPTHHQLKNQSIHQSIHQSKHKILVKPSSLANRAKAQYMHVHAHAHAHKASSSRHQTTSFTNQSHIYLQCQKSTHTSLHGWVSKLSSSSLSSSTCTPEKDPTCCKTQYVFLHSISLQPQKR